MGCGRLKGGGRLGCCLSVSWGVRKGRVKRGDRGLKSDGLGGGERGKGRTRLQILQSHSFTDISFRGLLRTESWTLPQ